MRKRILLLVLGAIISAGLVKVVFSQTSGGNSLPAPDVSSTIFAGEEGAAPDPGTTGATIIASIPEEQQCECGARIEGKLSDSEDWKVLALYAPMPTGDEYQQFLWTYSGNYFEQDETYDFRVLIFDRIGTQSEYGTTQMTMTPYKEPPCVDGSFANIKKDTIGTGEDAVIFFSWNKVCAESQVANRYVLYKNDTQEGESDQGANNIAVVGTPEGATWKIEAFGEEPANSDPSVIKTCSEVLTKMNAKTHGTEYSTQSRIINLDHCEVVGTWLRVIITWEPYINYGGYNPQNLSPIAWMTVTLGGGGTPQYFNYPPRHWNLRPGFPGQVFSDGFDKCGYNNQNTSGGSYTDPWGQVNWTCNEEYNPSNNAATYRYWVNFDLNATGGGGTVWPITTTFSY